MIVKVMHTIGHILNKKNIKIMLMIFAIVWLFFGQSFAAESGVSGVNEISSSMKTFLSILSWVWIVLASLAWKFMVNDILYGWFAHLDEVLWTLRNVMKNFANFMLGFLMIVAILKNLFSVWWWKWPLDTIKKCVIAWVLIQMSRFLLWATVDVSTIATTAIWSFPSQFMASNDEYKNVVRWKLWNLNKKVVFDPNNPENLLSTEPASTSINTEDDVNSVIDTIMPWYDNVSWPLIFIWIAYFDLLEIDYSHYVTRWDMFFDVWLELVLTVLYTFMMLFLFIFNFLRLIALWIIIPMMPLVILSSVFEIKFLDNIWWWTFKVWNILKLIFKPVLMVWALSLLFVIMMVIRWMIWVNVGSLEFSDNSTSFESQEQDGKYNSSMKVDGVLNLDFTWAKKSLADIVVYILWICFMFFLVWTAIWSSTGIKFIDDNISKLAKNIKDFAWAVPIVPIWWWKYVGAGTLKETIDNDVVWNDYLFNNIAKIDTREDTNKILKFFKLDNGSYADLRPTLRPDEFIDKAADIAISKNMTALQLFADRSFMRVLTARYNKHTDTQKWQVREGTIQEAIDKKQEKNKPNAGNQQEKAPESK